MSAPELQQLSFEAPFGAVGAQLVRPHGAGPFPAVLVLDEGCSVTSSLLAFAQRLAADGYLAFLPDLYSRDERDNSSHFLDALAAIEFLVHHTEVRRSAIASIGFGLGGGLSAQLAAAGVVLAAGVIFYGQGPAEDRLSHVRYPLLGHYAADDPAITPLVPELRAKLVAAGKRFTAFVYEGTQHGFFNSARGVYRPAAADSACARTLDFLATEMP